MLASGGGEGLNAAAIVTVAILGLLILIFLLLGMLLARFMADPGKRLEAVEKALGVVQTDLAGVRYQTDRVEDIDHSLGQVRLELAGVQAALERVERIANTIVNNALDSRGMA